MNINDIMIKQLERARESHEQRMGKASFCVIYDGKFPLLPNERYAEIQKEIRSYRGGEL
jgi:hypothetical protein